MTNKKRFFISAGVALLLAFTLTVALKTKRTVDQRVQESKNIQSPTSSSEDTK